jgi:hypothetical protein
MYSVIFTNLMCCCSFSNILDAYCDAMHTGWFRDGQTTARGPSTARWEAQCGPRKVSKMLKKIGFEKHLRIISMFASSYLCEQVFSSMKLRKISVRNRLTDGHLASLLRVTASQLEPEYENYWTLNRSSTCHTLHYTKEQKNLDT